MNIRSDTLIPNHAGWTGQLEDDERILWQGRPDGRVRIRASGLIMSVLGAVLLGFALFWVNVTFAMTVGETLWHWVLPALAIPVLALGVFMLIGQYIWDALRRRRTWYTLTDRRAFVARHLIRRNLTEYQIDARTSLQFQERRGGLGTIWFTANPTGGRKGRAGFELIGDARRVHKMMRFIQKDSLGKTGG
jgi:succinate dehydrogenase hydrophobic anchor subunit